MCMCGNLSYFIFISLMKYDGLPGGTVVKKKSVCQCRKCKRQWFNPRVGKIPGVGNGGQL